MFSSKWCVCVYNPVIVDNNANSTYTLILRILETVLFAFLLDVSVFKT